MIPVAYRPLLPLLVLPLLLVGCGQHPVTAPQPQPKAAQTAIVKAMQQADMTRHIDGSVTARAVLEYGNTVAKLLDGHAMFMSLTGTRIGVDGEPVRGGEWQLSYVGTNPVVNPSKATRSPYNQVYRRINVTVPADGNPRVEVVEAEGLPLGTCYYDSPMPAIDSDLAVEKARAMRPEAPAATGGFRLVLAGLMSQGHFQELVWKVNRATQGAEKPLTLSATTGEPILK